MSCVSARWRSWLSTRHMSCVSTMIVVRRSPAARSLGRSLARSLARSIACWLDLERGGEQGRRRERVPLRERQCFFGRDNVYSGETMCLLERQCVFWRDNVSSGETMCLPERQCVFRRDSVSLGDTMWLPETGCPGHKLISRSSLDGFRHHSKFK